MKLNTFIIMLSLMTASCATQEFIISDTGSRSKPTHSEEQTFFISGIGQTKEINTSEVCGGDHKVTKVANRRSPLDVLITLFQGIYTPREANVYCK